MLEEKKRQLFDSLMGRFSDICFTDGLEDPKCWDQTHCPATYHSHAPYGDQSLIETLLARQWRGDSMNDMVKGVEADI